MILGKLITITKAKNPSLIGITGTITNETKNTLTITTHNKTKTIIKDQIEETT